MRVPTKTVTALTFDMGLIDLGISSLDLTEAPFSFLYGPGDVATVVSNEVAGALNLTVTIPLTSSEVVEESGVTDPRLEVSEIGTRVDA